MAPDFRPSWKTGHTTIRELEAQLPSLRTVFAGWEAAKNAGLDLAYYTLTGDGHQAGIWEAGVYGEIRWVPTTDRSGNMVMGQEYRLADPTKVTSFITHWKRLVSRTDYHLRVVCAGTGKEVARA